MLKRSLLFALLASLSVVGLWGQGLETNAQKDDWEEINFEFDSSILTDGYPSLLRLAELLNEHSDYKVTLEGNTDFRGPDAYNQGLGARRAETVQAFLVKYGASASQVEIISRGEGAPKVSNETDEGRFMNRRVTMHVVDGEGNTISDGGVADAIENIQKMSDDCCNEILEKLSKLDEILDLLKNLQGENEKLKQDVAELKERPQHEPPPPAPTVAQVADAVEERLPKPSKKFVTFNVNAGPSSQSGNLSFTGSGRVFVPFATRHALQTQGEYMHNFDRDEGQFDAGLVNRWGSLQASGFASFKYVKFHDFQNAGALGQAAVNVDYIFNRGRVGFFGTKAFLDGAVVNTELISPTILEQTYLKVVNQVGVSTAVAAWGDSWFEGNFGAMFRRGGSNKPGGTIRYIHPLNRAVALTLEGGLNETLLTNDNSGRFVVGLQFGGWRSPKDYAELEQDAPVPVDVPRVRYEVLTRQIRTGNEPPVADGGGDQIGAAAGTITLDGSNSFDPEDDPITFAWTQTGGDTVSLSGADQAVATFEAEEGKQYHFRLTVRDDKGGLGTDRVTVATEDRRITIKRFNVSPSTVNRGESVTVVWDVSNATDVEIQPGLGNVDAAGSSTVTVNETTTFVLTASNGSNSINESITVTVLASPNVRVNSFTANPAEIDQGDSSVLAWETENATSASIEGIGSVQTNGTLTVSPTATTTYRLTAMGEDNQSDTKLVTVVVIEPGLPRIANFVATPQEILPGEFSSLSWETEGADTISISGLGDVDAVGTSDVSPTETTTYVLTATNSVGSVTAQAIVTVGAQVRIVNFTSNKTAVKNPGEPALLTWQTENAERVVITPDVGDVVVNGSVEVHPVGLTTYTLIAYGKNTETSAVLILDVENANQSPNAVAEAPRAILVPAGTTRGTGTLDGTKSSDPDGDPITFEWRQIGGPEAVIRSPNGSTTTVEFLGGYARYEFELMVTDDKGAMGFDTAVVFWVDP